MDSSFSLLLQVAGWLLDGHQDILIFDLPKSSAIPRLGNLR
jgi:hypothetical protein